MEIKDLEALLQEAEIIAKLSKLRQTIALGSQTSQRNSAESTLNREITKRVNDLSSSIIKSLKE